MLRSLKSRLTLLYVMILGVILVAFATSIYLTARRELLQDFDESVRRQAGAFTEVFFENLDRVRRHEAWPVDAYRDRIGASVAVYDGSGQVLYQSPDGALPFERVRGARSDWVRAAVGS